MARRLPNKDRAKATNPAPIPITVPVGMVTPDGACCRPEWVGEAVVVVGEAFIDDMVVFSSSREMT